MTLQFKPYQTPTVTGDCCSSRWCSQQPLPSGKQRGDNKSTTYLYCTLSKLLLLLLMLWSGRWSSEEVVRVCAEMILMQITLLFLLIFMLLLLLKPTRGLFKRRVCLTFSQQTPITDIWLSLNFIRCTEFTLTHFHFFCIWHWNQITFLDIFVLHFKMERHVWHNTILTLDTLFTTTLTSHGKNRFKCNLSIEFSTPKL